MLASTKFPKNLNKTRFPFVTYRAKKVNAYYTTNKIGPKHHVMFDTKFSCLMKQLTCPRSQATMSVIPFEMDIVKLGNTKGSKHRYQRKY